MLIRELALQTGVPAKTIRYYESIDLLPRPQRLANNYRQYTPATAERLRFIAGARSLGFSLTDIAEFLTARDQGTLPCQRVLESLDQRRLDIDRRIADLLSLRETLDQLRQDGARLPVDKQCDDQCLCYLITANQETGQVTIRNTGPVPDLQLKGRPIMAEEPPVIACGPQALPVDELKRLIRLSHDLFATVQEVRSLPDGYALRFLEEPGLLYRLADFVNSNRVCCSFLRHSVTVEPQGGSVWLQLTGAEGVKESLVPELVGLLPEKVVLAAGLRVSQADLVKKKAEVDQLAEQQGLPDDLAALLTAHIQFTE